MTEARIVIADRELSYAESLTMRVAMLHFLVWLQEDGAGLGEPLCTNYTHHARNLATVLTIAASLKSTSIPEPP